MKAEDEERKRAEALGDLRRLRTSETIAGSSLRTAVDRAMGHFAARDAASDAREDKAELWGRRIGRALSLAACVALALYLFATYMR